MKLTLPGILITALIAASPIAFAQNYSGTTSNPATSVLKDDTTSMTKSSKKHMASHKHRHHATAMSSKAQKSKAQNAKAMSSKVGTTGSGGSSAKPLKDDATSKSR